MVTKAVAAETGAVVMLFLQQAETEVTAETDMADLSALAALPEKESGHPTEVAELTVHCTKTIRTILKITIKSWLRIDI